MQLIGKLMGDPNKRDLKAIDPVVAKINALEPSMKKLSDEQLAAKTSEFRSQLALHLKGGLVLEDELVKLFREALEKVEPLAEKLTDAQLHAAITDYRQSLERKDAEYELRENLKNTLSLGFEQGYEKLSPRLNELRASATMDIAEQRQLWPDESENPGETTRTLLSEVVPALKEVEDEEWDEVFQGAWTRFDETRNTTAYKQKSEDEQLDDVERLFSNMLKSLQEEIVALQAEQMDTLLPEMAKRFRTGGKTLDDLLPEVFAVVREVSWRKIKMRHFDVQLIGGIVLHQGKIAEMKTGEGKTLVATLPLYLNALTGKGVHLVTVNDYLASLGASWMGSIYKFLGLTVGILVNAVEPQSAVRRAVYQADITYGTNNEFGFDYLRDNMVASLDQMVQRPLNYAIVDEVDSILIDEARTPLIISGAGQESTDQYVRFARLAPRLKPELDYTVEERTRTVILTDAGIEKIEQMAGVSNIYSEANVDLTRYMENAIKAEVIFKRDKDYIVKDGEIVIVDEFTGRQMPGRRYSEGLHQAIEAKEGVQVQRENHTLATITFQNYFRLYDKLAGMTGTALTEAEEFHKIYKLDVMVIPTNKPMIRKDQSDLIYRNQNGKYNAVVQEIRERHEKGQPVLVGTTSVEHSELLSELLERVGIPHNVLNAKQHAREAQIVAQAGRSGAVTIATNMAGRGTDIVLGGNPEGYFDSILRKHAEQDSLIRDMPTRTPDEREEKEEAIQQYIDGMSEEEKSTLFKQKEQECAEDHERVVELGGLYIIGTERHESRRIDHQLRGRAGRQGDPGESRFFLSMDDDLLKRFGTDRVGNIMERVGLEEDVPLENKMVSNLIEGSQVRVEGYNFDIRKNVVDYDDVIAKQREVIYDDRRAILERSDMHKRIQDMIREEVARLVNTHIPGNVVTEDEQLEQLYKAIEAWVPVPAELVPDNLHAVRREDIKEDLTNLVIDTYEERGEELRQKAKELGVEGIDYQRDFERSSLLQILDLLWMDHIDALDVMRAGIQFRSIGQRDPLVEFKNEAFRMFEDLKRAIQQYTVDRILRARIELRAEQPEPPRKAQRKLPNQPRTNADAIAQSSGQSKSDSNARKNGNQARSNGNGKSPALAKASVPQKGMPGRNDPCPCGSGKKYKKCHGA